MAPSSNTWFKKKNCFLRWQWGGELGLNLGAHPGKPCVLQLSHLLNLKTWLLASWVVECGVSHAAFSQLTLTISPLGQSLLGNHSDPKATFERWWSGDSQRELANYSSHCWKNGNSSPWLLTSRPQWWTLFMSAYDSIVTYLDFFPPYLVNLQKKFPEVEFPEQRNTSRLFNALRHTIIQTHLLSVYEFIYNRPITSYQYLFPRGWLYAPHLSRTPIWQQLHQHHVPSSLGKEALGICRPEFSRQAKS